MRSYEMIIQTFIITINILSIITTIVIITTITTTTI